MNTSQIKTFAIQSRNVLKAGVLNRILALGFNEKGEPAVDRPVKIQGGTIFTSQLRDEGFYDAWTALETKLRKHGIKEVCEEAAYTWFNRLVAIRIMQKNHFIEPVMQYVSPESRIPVIVDQARSGRLSLKMSAQDQAKLDELLRDSTKTNDQFNLLISAFCLDNPVIFKCFGGIEKHIALLLPDNILSQGGFIDMLNNTPYLTDEDYSKSELIGWLYQFYISEKKDEVFAKKGKYTPDEIPAATQIFTPNWIVKYMVENTIGRIYLDNNPYADDIKAEMKYLVEPAEPTPKDAILKLDDLTEYKMIDNACGSGHILIEGFNLFYRMYMYEGYARRTAIENILTKNIIGIDLDTRAKQLATFALLMTAARLDKSFLDCKVMPRVLDFPEPFTYTGGTWEDFFPHYYLGCSQKVLDETIKAFELMKQAESLGSIMKFDISAETRAAMEKSTAEWEKREFLNGEIAEAVKTMKIILALTDKYAAACANPPYMGSARFDAVLSGYIERNYRKSKADLFAVFIEQMLSLIQKKGRVGCITMESWMFLSSFELLRSSLLENHTIESLIHMPYIGKGGTSLGINFGTAACIFNQSFFDFKTSYQCIRYFELTKDLTLPLSFPTINERFCKNQQTRFESIPGKIMGYWLSDKFISLFEEAPLGDVLVTREGMATADNDRFLRLWPEISIKRMSLFNPKSNKWFPYNKGGAFRRWYGNREYVVDWEDDGKAIKNNKDPETGRIRSHNYNGEYAFRECITWSALSTGNISIRYCDKGFLWDSKGACGFSEESLKYSLALLNSVVARQFLDILSPTMDYKVGDIIQVPCVKKLEHTSAIEAIAEECINISKRDWDAHETSWDFLTNELVRIYNAESVGEGLFVNANRLEDIVTLYKEYWSAHFDKLRSNEINLNRHFIEVYGIEDELNPLVPLKEVSILKDGEISFVDNKIVWHDDVLIKQLISYAIGCWMGRYRLDKEGLNIAHYPKDEEVCSYEVNGYTFEIDDDAIIPLMGKDNPFEDDNALQKCINFLKFVFGGDNYLTENMNYVEHCLGKTLETYLIKDFWKDHKKMYQNRPIYWLFSSKKGAFQVLTYMHRMNPYTAEKIRTKYLLPYIQYLEGRIEVDEARGSDLSTVERQNLTKMKAALEECREYHDRLHEVAIQNIGFDLDDGVVVNYAKFGDVVAKIK